VERTPVGRSRLPDLCRPSEDEPHRPRPGASVPNLPSATQKPIGRTRRAGSEGEASASKTEAEILAAIALDDLNNMMDLDPERKDFYITFTVIGASINDETKPAEFLHSSTIRSDVANIVAFSSKNIRTAVWQQVSKNQPRHGMCLYIKIR